MIAQWLAHFLNRSSVDEKKCVCAHTHGHIQTHTWYLSVREGRPWKRFQCLWIYDPERGKQSHVKIADSQSACLWGAAVKGSPMQAFRASCTIHAAGRITLCVFTSEDTLRERLLRSTYKSERCVAPGLPEALTVHQLVPKVYHGKGLLPLPVWLHTYPPSVWSWSRQWGGAAAESQAGRPRRAGASRGTLSGRPTARGSLPATRTPGQVGFTLQMRAALLRVCTSFLLGLWPLLSTSRWNFLWTLLYLNSPVSSEKTAVRLLCNSAAKRRGIERWFSQTIPERRVHRAGLRTTPEASTSLYSVYLEWKVPDFK